MWSIILHFTINIEIAFREEAVHGRKATELALTYT
jgi:hypothetical protein